MLEQEGNLARVSDQSPDESSDAFVVTSQDEQVATDEQTARARAALGIEESPYQSEHHERAYKALANLKKTVEHHQVALEARTEGMHKLVKWFLNFFKKLEAQKANLIRYQELIDQHTSRLHDATPDIAATHMSSIQELQTQIEAEVGEIQRMAASKVPTEMLEAEKPENFQIDSGGKMADSWTGDDGKGTAVKARLHETGKIGQYGQDYLRVNKESGIAIVADGVSSAGDKSYDVARASVLALESELLRLMNEALNTEAELDFFLRGELMTALEKIEGQGACTLLGSIYLPEHDLVVSLSIGDSEQALVVGDEVYSLGPTIEEGKIGDIPDDAKQGRHKQMSRLHDSIQRIGTRRGTKGQIVINIYNIGLYREQAQGAPIHLLQSSDGLRNVTGQGLEDHAQDLVSNGVQATIDKISAELYANDDITVTSTAL